MSYVYAGQYGAEQMVNSSGAPLSNTAITVYTHGTTTLATLYTDRTKATQAANPVTTDSVGNLIFWADPGQYDLTVSGLPTTNTVLVPLDPSETSVVSSTAVGGDVSGTISAETVAKIEGFALASTTPTSNQALVWDSSTSKWTPTTMVAADVTNAADTSSASTQTFTGDVKAPALIASGLTGATAASRYVGATTIGAPPTGTFVTGDFVIDQSGAVYVCTTGGSPGTWVRGGPGGSAGGDLSGTYPSPTVAKIQGTAVSSTAPTTNQGLVYNGSLWLPSAIANSVFGRTGAVVATSGDYTAAEVTNAADTSSASTQTFTGDVKAPALIASGLTGATAASRYVGATSSGAPASGTFAVGDFVLDQSGALWVCTTAGSPGTWTKVGGSSLASPVESFISTDQSVSTSGVFNITSISVPAGTWKLLAQVNLNESGSNTAGSLAIGPTSASITGAYVGTSYNLTSSGNDSPYFFAAPVQTFASTTTVYLLIDAGNTLTVKAKTSYYSLSNCTGLMALAA